MKFLIYTLISIFFVGSAVATTSTEKQGAGPQLTMCVSNETNQPWGRVELAWGFSFEIDFSTGAVTKNTPEDGSQVCGTEKASEFTSGRFCLDGDNQSFFVEVDSGEEEAYRVYFENIDGSLEFDLFEKEWLQDDPKMECLD